MPYSDFVNYAVDVADRVATVRMHSFGSAHRAGEPVEPHWELASLLDRVQFDNGIRVVVLTGAEDGEFLAPRPVAGPTPGPVYRSPEWLWKVSTGIIRTLRLMAELDKPIVARVNGDALGVGAILMFSCDIIVAREDARVADHHMGMGEVEPCHWNTGVVPGDGGAALLPLFMPPTLAKESLLLARQFTGGELAGMGIVNHAVTADRLDERVEAIVAGLMRRPAYALAWTKRVANRHILDQLARTADAGVAYELVNMLQFVAEGVDRFSLD